VQLSTKTNRSKIHDTICSVQSKANAAALRVLPESDIPCQESENLIRQVHLVTKIIRSIHRNFRMDLREIQRFQLKVALRMEIWVLNHQTASLSHSNSEENANVSTSSEEVIRRSAIREDSEAISERLSHIHYPIVSQPPFPRDSTQSKGRSETTYTDGIFATK
jgi:hypothetical protein